MNSVRRAPLVVVLLAICASAPAHAQAKDPAKEERDRRARERYDKGITHYNLGEFDAAITEFKAAYEINSSPSLLFNIAQAYRLKKDYEQALYFYKTYLRLKPDAKNRADVEARIQEMEKIAADTARIQNERPRGAILPDGNQTDETPVDTGTGAGPETGPGTAIGPGAGGPDTGAGTVLTDGHKRPGPLAGLMRVDVAPLSNEARGAVAVVGASYHFREQVSATAAALLGQRNQGVWLGGTVLFTSGAWQPRASLGMPLILTDGILPGLQAGAGIQWNMTPRLALLAEATVAFFPTAPDDVQKANFLPMIGIQGRIGSSNGRARAVVIPSPMVKPVASIEAPAVDADRDGDGIVDKRDTCPGEAETKNGVEDGDGCPEKDLDGDGLLGNADLCPKDAEDKDGVKDDDGCPDLDDDGDGIADAADACRDKAEDADRFQDDDGCPDPDNDGDGLLDGDDKCPGEAETFNGNKDDDGCPDRGAVLILVTSEKIEIKEQINFATNKAKIKKKSHKLLATVAKALLLHPEIKKVRIERHTDDRGGRDKNLALSQKRADSVRAHLIEMNGIEPERLEAVGYGKDRPLTDDKSRKGQALNRRVEFVIVERE